MFLKSAGKNGTKETKNDMKRAKFIINEAASDKEILNYTESVIGCLMMNQIVNHVDVIYTNKAEDALKEAQKMIEGEYDFDIYDAYGLNGPGFNILRNQSRGGSVEY